MRYICHEIHVELPGYDSELHICTCERCTHLQASLFRVDVEMYARQKRKGRDGIGKKAILMKVIKIPYVLDIYKYS
jgi:hypothetical protein